MTQLVYLIPAALLLGGISLVAFLWALRSGQYDDLDGASQRILIDDGPEARFLAPHRFSDIPRQTDSPGRIG